MTTNDEAVSPSSLENVGNDFTEVPDPNIPGEV